MGKTVWASGFLVFLGPVLLWGHDAVSTKLTWTREISRIFEKRCVGCHREGGAAPMSLRSFAEAKPWAVAIKEAVLTRQMPPWPVAKGFGEFRNDSSLPQEEIVRIAEWVEGGAPEGEAIYLKPVNFAATRARVGGVPGGREMVIGPGTVWAGGGEIVALRVERAGKLWTGAVPLVWGLRRDRQWLELREPLRLPAGARFAGTGRVTVRVRP